MLCLPTNREMDSRTDRQTTRPTDRQIDWLTGVKKCTLVVKGTMPSGHSVGCLLNDYREGARSQTLWLSR